MNFEKLFLQIPHTDDVLDLAQTVQNGDGSGYTFAVTILTFGLILFAGAIVALYRNNNKLKNEYVGLAEKSIKAFSEVNIKLESQDKLERKMGEIKEIVTNKLHEFEKVLYKNNNKKEN